MALESTLLQCWGETGVTVMEDMKESENHLLSPGPWVGSVCLFPWVTQKKRNGLKERAEWVHQKEEIWFYTYNRWNPQRMEVGWEEGHLYADCCMDRGEPRDNIYGGNEGQ